MVAVTVEQAKVHCRVDFDDDDDYLAELIEAAEGHLESIGVDMEADPLPAPIVQAVLLLVAHWYEHREAVVMAAGNSSPAVVPFAVDSLTAPFRETCI